MLAQRMTKEHRLPIVASGFILFLLTLLVSRISTGNFSYSSRANVEEKLQTIQQRSQEPLAIPSEKLPKCITGGEYLPNAEGSVCYISVKCSSKTIKTMQSPECLSLSSWMGKAAEECGCKS